MASAKYLFPLDVDAADLAVPANVYESKYKQLPREEILPALLLVNLPWLRSTIQLYI